MHYARSICAPEAVQRSSGPQKTAVLRMTRTRLLFFRLLLDRLLEQFRINSGV